jgi:signal transduction histidine kinase
MKARPSPERLTARSHRLVLLISFLMILAVLLRRRNDLAGSLQLDQVYFLVGLFTALFASDALISRKWKGYYRFYFALQLAIVLLVGMFPEYQDTWAELLIVLGFQVGRHCGRNEAFIWFGLFAAALLSVLSIEFGLVSGLGRAAAYSVLGVLFISYDIQYARHEDALAESQVLLDELRQAHQKLAEYAGQAEALAAAQEHSRMIRELYDSVGQKVFAIQLAAETARLILKSDPAQATERLDDLQLQTQSALGQMRQLIGQWRPG